METVNKYLINEGATSKSIGSLVKAFQAEHSKRLAKFEKLANAKISKIDDLEGLENFRDMDMNRMDLYDDVAGILSNVIEDRIEQIWQEDMVPYGHGK
jgi:hypothetical protein